MKPKAILLIHGMGQHAAPTDKKPGSFGREFIDATTATLQQFPRHKQDKLENHFDLHEFNYDAWFDQMRTTMADNATQMSERLEAVGAIYGASVPLNLATQLAGLEEKFGSDKFFYTHWLDVIFYGTMLGAKVRVDAGAEIARLVQLYGAGNVHVIAHSLGTAVAHDTLALLYRADSRPDDDVPDLHPINHQLGSVWMFANVSRLVNSVTRLCDPLDSIVRPGPGGCTPAFFNIHHRLDPFTWLARFDPANDGAWVPGNIYSSRYANVTTELLVEMNTHSFPRYLQDPRVIPLLFPFLLGDDFQASFAEVKQVADAYAANSLNGKFTALEQSLKDLANSPAEIADWAEFLKTATTFGQAVQALGGKF